MKSILKYAVFNLLSLCTPLLYAATISDNYQAKWTGIEVMGVDRATADKVRQIVPIKMGETFTVSEREKTRKMCTDAIKRHLKTDNVSCGILLYGDSIVYLLVDFFPASTSESYRTIPTKNGKIAKLPKVLMDLYAEKEKRTEFLMSNDSFPIENDEKEFIDYLDPILHVIALELSQHAWKFNADLLDIVRYSPNAEDRTIAAELFSWSKHPENLKYILEWDLLFDPHTGVRNYIARSHSFLIPQIKDKTVLHKLFPAYCRQAKLPDHTDRNKALYSMREILQSHPDEAKTVDNECKNTLTYISEMSILDNVGPIAKEVLDIINKENHA